jgi:cytochrome c oxidase subunit 1
MSMGALFAMFAGFYYWIGRMSGRQYSETLGRIHFWVMFIGVNLTFIPQHFSSLSGMKRGVLDTADAHAGWADAYAGWNMVSSLGAYLSAAGAVLFLAIVWRTLTAGAPAGANPWGAGATTDEWKVSSPPPFRHHDAAPDSGRHDAQSAQPAQPETPDTPGTSGTRTI